jgi:hypothetical protein
MFRLRFRLITLLAVMTLLAPLTAVGGALYRAKVAENKAIQQIAQNGGWVIRYKRFGTSVYLFEKVPRRGPRLGCRGLVSCTHGPTGSATDYGDRHLESAAEIRDLRSINLQGVSCSQAALDNFKRLKPACRVEL